MHTENTSQVNPITDKGPGGLPLTRAFARRNRDLLRRTADILVDELIEAGVDTIFGMPGGNIAPLFDALLDRPSVRVITTRHESHAVFAAAGYAQTTGKLGVAAVTSGPGVLNTFNPLASAQADGLPVLVLAGEASRKGFGRGAIQEGSAYALNLVGMASHITKLAFEAHDARSAPAMLRRGIAAATSGRRGSVFASLPFDVQGDLISRPSVALDATTHYRVAPDSLSQVKKALSADGRRVIFVGSGARWGRGPALVKELAERLQCPVMTTPKAKGVFPESHPLSLGVFGVGGHASARDWLEGGADVVLVLGSSLKEDSTDCWSTSLRARRSFIHVDIDPTKIGKAFPTDLGICAPVETVLTDLLPLLPPQGTHRTFSVTRDVDARALGDAQKEITAPRAIWELQQVVPTDTIFTADSGSNAFNAIHYLAVDRADSFVILFGLASMGSGLPAALGAQVGSTKRTVVAICGDGGFHMAAAELATVAQHEMPLVVLVLNDRRLGMVEVGHMRLYGRTPLWGTGPLSIPDLARASGADCLVVERPGQILAAGIEQRKSKRPLVIDARVDASTPLPATRRLDTLKGAIASERPN